MKSPIPVQAIFEEKSVWKILFHIAPPVMLALLIQSMYNIVDSFFVGQYSGDGLTALSVIYPIQLIAIAIAVGTGVGVNTQMSRFYAVRQERRANFTAGTGTVLAVISWAIFSIISALAIRPYAEISASSPEVIDQTVTYGMIVCIGSLGQFLEGIWSKVHQAGGNMRLPMIAQVLGAVTNIVLDPLLIFGIGPIPGAGIAGAAWATVIGQAVAAIVTCSGFRKPPKFSVMSKYVKRIYKLGYPNIFMQLMYTVYIGALNMILAGFCDEAVTVLGLYYKVQSFFFIPLSGLQTCVVPLLSYTYAKADYQRCRSVFRKTILLSMSFMLLGVAAFELIPGALLSVFSSNALVHEIGIPAFRIIGSSFLLAVPALMIPVFFQAIGGALPSILLSIVRQLLGLIPIFWFMSRFGLTYCWTAFPLAELLTTTIGLLLYHHQLTLWNINPIRKPNHNKKEIVSMKMVTAIISKKDTDEVCRSLTESGFYFTKMASTGGFLSWGNSTLMIGTEAEHVSQVINLIRAHCSRRLEEISPTVPQPARSMTMPTQVVVGGATVFVTDVEQFEKI